MFIKLNDKSGMKVIIDKTQFIQRLKNGDWYLVSISLFSWIHSTEVTGSGINRPALEKASEVYQLNNGADNQRDIDYSLSRDPLTTRVQNKAMPKKAKSANRI